MDVPRRKDMLSTGARCLGRLSGLFVMRIGLAYLRRRAARFEIQIDGSERLHPFGEGVYVIVSNHVRPEVPAYGLFSNLRIARHFNHSLDSFIFYRIVKEQTGRHLGVIAICDRGRWSPRPILRFLQKRLGQPFAKAQMEAMGYIPVEASPGCFQRDFLRSAERAVKRGQPLLIFPAGDDSCDFETGARLRPGAAHLALHFGAPIVPACIRGTGSWNPPGRAVVHFGEPFSPVGRTKRELNDRIAREIGRLLHPSVGGDAPAASPSR